jgi:uncharacterized membrane protein/YHS domain-containing protein
MNRKWTRLSLLFAVLICAPLFAQSIPTGMNEWCPVTTDEKAEADIWLDFEGRRIYFCCKGCRKDFLANPGEFLGNLPPPAPVVATSEHPEQHDHTRDHHAASSPIRLLGKLHPLVVHFPIALILAAFLAEALFVATKRETFDHCTRFILPLGAAGAVVAASVGWIDALYVNYPGELETVLFRHRWLGVSTAVTALTAAILYETAKRTNDRSSRIGYRVALTLATLLVGLTGHLGASLIYGTDYFSI